MRLVLIKWRDAYGGTTGWKHLDDITPDDLVCRSVGWLLHDRDDYKVIVPHLVEPPEDSRVAEQGRGDMCIPSGMVIRMVDLIQPSESAGVTSSSPS